MKLLRTGAKVPAIFLLTLTSLIGASMPAHAQSGIRAILEIFDTGRSELGSIVVRGGGKCFLAERVYYNRGEVWYQDYKIDATVIFTAPRDADIKYLTVKENSRDILVELLDGNLVYGLFDSARCTWNFINVTKIPEGLSASPEKVVGDALYALSTADVHVSRDTGRTWQEDTTGLGSDILSDIALDSLQFVYGVSPNHLYKQHPDSSVWRKVESYPNFPASFDLAAVFVDRRNRIFVGAGSKGVYLSTDSGNSWTSDTAGMGKVQVLTFGDDDSGNIYAPLGNMLYRSPGGIQPWVRIDGGLTALTGPGVGINTVGGDSLIVATTNFGHFISTDHGTTWSDASQRLSADKVTGLLHLSAGKVFVGAPRGIYFKNATDTIWTKSYPPGRYQSGLTLATDGVGNIYTIDRSFAGPLGGYGYPVKSTDNGVTWNLDTAGVSNLHSRGISADVFYVDESGGQHSSLWPGTNSWFPYKKAAGGTWTVDSAGMNISPTSFDGQYDLTGDGTGNLYCSNANTGMFKRSVTGNVWTSDTVGLGTTRVTRLCRGKNGDIYGSASGGIYYVRRAGVWRKLNPPSAVSIGFTSAISVDASGAFIVAVKGGFPQIGEGVYYTKDDGQSWTKAGLDSLSVTKLVSYGDSTYVLTNNRGVYLLTTTGNTGVQNESQTPLKFALLQNYPNPFNPSTTIKFELPRATYVTLKVCDILGREVSVLVNGRRDAGVQEVKFEGSHLASGVYFYRLQAGDFVQTRKLLLLR